MAIVYDYSFSGGTPITLNSDEAISRALRNFLTSNPSDFIKNESGGVINSAIFKNMNQTNFISIRFKIKNAIVNGFTPEISLSGIEIVPDYENRLFTINISFRSPFTGSTIQTNIFTKDLSDREREYSIINIPYIGDNLINFSRMKKFQLQHQKLVIDQSDNKYYFGNYLLQNLTSSSAELNQVVNILNA